MHGGVDHRAAFTGAIPRGMSHGDTGGGTGAGNRNRTGTPVKARDFESRASTYSAIPARKRITDGLSPIARGVERDVLA
jgi:hypothetical protein